MFRKDRVQGLPPLFERAPSSFDAASFLSGLPTPLRGTTVDLVSLVADRVLPLIEKPFVIRVVARIEEEKGTALYLHTHMPLGYS